MLSPAPDPADPDPSGAALAECLPLTRTVALVGLMGAGKTAVGWRLARALGAPFEDTDELIVAAAAMDIPEIFARYGEAEFRNLERRVIARVLDGPPRVLALGGGAFIDPATRGKLKARALTIWLRAQLDTLVARTARKRGTRPLLAQGDPREILSRLIEQRYPIYAEADQVVDTGDQPAEAVVERIVALLREAAAAGGAR